MGYAISIPFEGDPYVANIIANAQNTDGNPLGFVDVPLFELRFSIKHGEGSLEHEFSTRRSVIQEIVLRVNDEISAYNQRLREVLADELRKRIAMFKDAASSLDRLRIPLKTRPNLPNLGTVPLRKRPIPANPKALAPTQPEPGILDADYEGILNVIRFAGRTFEGSPLTFLKHPESELRDIMLACLNCYYEGQATGETFRKMGRTDIHIDFDGRSAFVAECKIWRGPAGLAKAVDQIDSYLTWRDYKSSVVVFNTRRKRGVRLLHQISDSLQRHERWRKTLPLTLTEHGEGRYLFSAREETSRLITLHVFLFNLYVPGNRE